MSETTDFVPRKPYVGMGCTRNAVSDCDPCTIIAMSKSGKSITIQDDEFQIISGSECDGTAQYEYYYNPRGSISGATMRKDGSYRLKGSCKGYGRVNIGFRRRYRDPSF